jgi:peptide/nickel transport system substrate-binding protein
MKGMAMRTNLKLSQLVAGVVVAWGSTVIAQDGAKVLRVVPQADLKILDPIWTTAQVSRNHGYNVYDTLFGVDVQGKVQPQMVDQYEVSADGLIWRFSLRKGLAFHDGKPVTSADVIASLQRWGQRDSLGQKMMAALERMDALSERSFRLVFKQSFGMVREALGKPSSSPAFIMPARVAATSADQQIDDATGSGPYIFKQDEYRPGEKVVYVKNTKYIPRPEPPSGTAGGKQVYVDRMEWVILKDAQTQANALLNGEIDMIEWVPAEQYTALKANAQVVLDPTLPRASYTLHLNHWLPPFSNPKIAQAAIMTIHQEALMRAQQVHKALYSGCLSIYPCGSQYATTQNAYFTGTPMLAKAKALLQEAGYDGKPVVLMHPADFTMLNKLAPVMAQLLKQAGFNVDMQTMDWPTLVMRRAKKDPVEKGGWNMFITSWGMADSMNPLFFAPMTGNGERGWFGWTTDTKLESLKSEFLAARDEAARKSLAAAIQQQVLDTGIYAPIGEYTVLSAYRKNISGVLHAPVNVFWNIKKQ